EARNKLEELLKHGAALEKFRKLIIAQGGNPVVIENPKLMPTAKLSFEYVPAGDKTRWVKNLDGRKVAEACKLMGAGREKKNDPIDLAVGIVLSAKVGTKLESGQAAAKIYSNSEEQFKAAAKKL